MGKCALSAAISYLGVARIALIANVLNQHRIFDTVDMNCENTIKRISTMILLKV